jgi:hypothetical protein
MSIVIETGGPAPDADEYLNPVYWQPHDVGDGDALLVPQDVPSTTEGDYVRSILREYAAAGGSGVAINTFNPGDEFNIADHPPGTMFGFDVEYLHAADGLSVDHDSYAGAQPPVRVPNYWPKATITQLRGDYCSYVSFASGTVAVHSKREEPRAIGAYLGTSSEITDSGVVYHPSQFTVGDVRHVRYGADGPQVALQVLSRINRVDLLVPGKTQTKRRTVLSLGGLLRPRIQGI